MYTPKQYKNLKTMTNDEIVREKQTTTKHIHELEKKYLDSESVSLIAITSVDAPMYVEAVNRLEEIIKEIRSRIENGTWYF